tara:strand:+ start:13828 stop:14067 length:240 start_codon:yes stop_codon:yes gene_type:complete
LFKGFGGSEYLTYLHHMESEIKKLLKGGRRNEKFLLDIYKADGDEAPGRLESELQKSAFALTYYGWLVGKYGCEWRLHI